MRYLLDINILLAANHTGHRDHARAMRWLASVRGAEFLTTPITELGFVRIAAASGLQPSVVAARKTLARWTKAAGAELIPDSLGADRLPTWADTPAKTTDGHLVEVARAHDAKLATMDTGIADALLIP